MVPDPYSHSRSTDIFVLEKNDDGKLIKVHCGTYWVSIGSRLTVGTFASSSILWDWNWLACDDMHNILTEKLCGRDNRNGVGKRNCAVTWIRFSKQKVVNFLISPPIIMRMCMSYANVEWRLTTGAFVPDMWTFLIARTWSKNDVCEWDIISVFSVFEATLNARFYRWLGAIPAFFVRQNGILNFTKLLSV